MLENEPGRQKARSFIDITRRAQLVGCAIEVIAELGETRASLVKIAERAGVSRGVISYHFDDRDELIRLVVAEVYERGRAVVQPRIEAQSTAAGQIREFIVGSVEFYGRYPRYIAALTAIRVSAAQQRTANPTRGAVTDELDAVARILRRGQDDGEFRDFDAAVMATTIRKALDGAVEHVLAGGAGEPYAAELTELFRLALCRNPRNPHSEETLLS
ncbi:TetR/AcrR family transcriptional regulator [Pseudonocardia spinosispora]|uniref:TetR/AcrR family transcriptional regulator n=1 Tax=Pseudonocardia spinosispora TaxID=103441 RepID=UPI00040B3C7E|nr:TetR/AcrR family transcriptional regulator [Pseudonocardia spinosispora]